MVLARLVLQHPKRTDDHPELKDFYNDFDDLNVTPTDKDKFAELLKTLEKEKIDPKLLKTERNFYVVDFKNIGGLVMPLILKVDYTDGTMEEMRIPAEIWRMNNDKVSKLIMMNKEIKSLQLDPHQETADVDVENNFWPRRPVKSHFQLFQEEKLKNPMQQKKIEEEKAKKDAEKEKK